MNLWHAISDFVWRQGRRANPLDDDRDARIMETHRVDPPITTEITLTRHNIGITIDFPLTDDCGSINNDQGWRDFGIGLLLSLGPIIGFLILMQLRIAGLGYYYALGIAFLLGLLSFVFSAQKATNAIQQFDMDRADEVRQLAVVENLLVRTSRDHRKKVWTRDEIFKIRLVSRESAHQSQGASGPDLDLRVVVFLKSGESFNLVVLDKAVPRTDYFPLEELEWVTTQLRHALWRTESDPESHLGTSTHLDAIHAKDSPQEETRYTE